MLLAGYRLDGRSTSEYREISFRFPQGYDTQHEGCCLVKIGATTVLARISAEVVEPKHFRPSQGMLFVNFDTSILNQIGDGRQNQLAEEESRRLSSVLQTLLRDCVDLDSLCIVAWERVFAIRLDLRALAFDGNLGDCGALAAVTALSVFRHPDVVVSEKGEVTVDWTGKLHPHVPLGIRRLPVLVTIGLALHGSKILLEDTSAREEALLETLSSQVHSTRGVGVHGGGGGRVMIGLTADGEICSLSTAGITAPLSSDSINRCVRIAMNRSNSLVALVRRVLSGITRARKVTQAQRIAHQSDVSKASEAAKRVPLVLSSTRFMSDEVCWTDKQLGTEEGEVTMDVASSSSGAISDEENGSAGEEVAPANPAASAVKSEPTTCAGDPYGVIEVSSLCLTASPPRTTIKEEYD